MFRLLPLLVGVLVLCSSDPVRADIVTFRFEGSLSRAGGVVENRFTTSMPFAMTMGWDTSQPTFGGLVYDDGSSWDVFGGAFQFWRAEFGSDVYTMRRPAGNLTVYNRIDPTGEDGLLLYLDTAGDLYDDPDLPFFLWNTEFWLGFASNTWGTSTSLPGQLPSTTNGRVIFYFSDASRPFWNPTLNGLVVANVDEVRSVPEPSTLGLILLGAALTLRRRRA